MWIKLIAVLLGAVVSFSLMQHFIINLTMEYLLFILGGLGLFVIMLSVFMMRGFSSWLLLLTGGFVVGGAGYWLWKNESF